MMQEAVDALYLVTFAYEDIVRFSDFCHPPNYAISIDSYVIYRWYEDSKDGHLVTIKDLKRSGASDLYKDNIKWKMVGSN